MKSLLVSIATIFKSIYLFSLGLAELLKIVQINCWCDISYIFSLKLSFTVIQNNSYDEATVLLFQLLRDPLCCLTTWASPHKNHHFHEEHRKLENSGVQSFPTQFRPLCHRVPRHLEEKMVLFCYPKALLVLIPENSTFPPAISVPGAVVLISSTVNQSNVQHGVKNGHRPSYTETQ